MGRIRSTLCGPIKNHIGNVIYQVSRGINVLRSMPSHYTDLNSLLQQYQRAKFQTCNAFFSIFGGVVLLIWEPKKKGLSNRNAIIRHNMAYAMTGGLLAWDMDYPNVKFVNGPLGLQFNMTAAYSGSNFDVDIAWDGTVLQKTDPTDELLLFFYCEDKIWSNCIPTGAVRVTGVYTAVLAGDLAGKTIHIWGAWQNVGCTHYSPTVYLGSVTFP